MENKKEMIEGGKEPQQNMKNINREHKRRESKAEMKQF